MPRKVPSTIFYIVAGFFVCVVSLLASSIQLTGSVWVKFAIVGGFSVPAIVALVTGLVSSDFRHWKRDVGIVIVSGQAQQHLGA